MLLNRFRPKVKPRSRKDMIAYLAEHFRYDTMNSWNQSTSYAQNVKVTRLQFPSKAIADRAWAIIGCENADGAFDDTNELIREFTDAQGGSYTAGFNGRSDGYLVLYQSERKPSPYTHRCDGCGHRAYGENASGHNFAGCDGKHVPHKFPLQVVTWPGRGLDMERDFESWDTYSLRNRVDLVWEFDKLAENCVAAFIAFCESHHIEDVEVTTTRTVCATVEDEPLPGKPTRAKDRELNALLQSASDAQKGGTR